MPVRLAASVKLLRSVWNRFGEDRTRDQRTTGTEDLSMSRMLLDARALGSSEPRDKVFALQGTLARLGADLSCPDYSRSVETIYTEATTAAIKFDQNLSILAGLTGCRTCEELPSWVPDCFGSGSMTEIASWGESKAAAA